MMRSATEKELKALAQAVEMARKEAELLARNKEAARQMLLRINVQYCQVPRR